MHYGPLVISPSPSLILNRVGKSARVAGLLIPTLSERAFKILVLDQRWILWIKRQWPLIAEEDVSKNAELSPGKMPVPQK